MQTDPNLRQLTLRITNKGEMRASFFASNTRRPSHCRLAASRVSFALLLFALITPIVSAQSARALAKAAASEFLAANKQRPGVGVTKSGLQYEILKSGDSEAHPRNRDKVTLDFHGTLIDGTVFETSRGKDPITAPMSRLIVGWREGLKMMSPGDKYKLYLPSHLGYGSEKVGSIPPYSVLIFEIKLLAILEKGR